MKRYRIVLYTLILTFLYFVIGNQGVMVTNGSDIEVSNSDEEIDLDKYSPYRDIKKVALTFDDGPDSINTTKLLDGLKERNVKATFFLIGAKAYANPEIVKRMYDEGHLIGNHTNTHCRLTKVSYESAICDISLASENIFSIIGDYPDYIRPPFGEYTSKLKESSEMFEILWSLDPRDWSVLNENTVANYVIKKVKDGDIIILHDIFDTSVKAAFIIIDELTKQGYTFVRIDELLY